MALVVTGVFYRSAWRYRDRAYRRICLDTGHLLGNIELASALTDYRPHLIASFADQAMAQLLYLDAARRGTFGGAAPGGFAGGGAKPALHPAGLFATPQTTFLAVPDGQLLTYFPPGTEIDPPS
jgi:hypothetical protein